MNLHSCIYEGTVRHRRHAPVAHSFDYRLFMIYLDLDELDHVFDGYWLWSVENFNLAQFRRADHLGPKSQPLRSSVEELVEKKTGKTPLGPIRLLTHLRYFGYCFNPVSFYFCFDKEAQSVDAIVAEINNTPWGEQHCYVLDESSNRGTAAKKRYEFGKQFHVSPFMPMNMNYSWNFTAPDRTLSIHMDSLDATGRVFDATMVLSRQPISSRSLARVLAGYPLMTGKVIAAIYWNALLLWIKKCPFYSHPAKSRRNLEP